jgi:hypothetical protein
MNNSLIEFLERNIKNEQKWMYHYDIDDCAFGVETDKYRWCRQVLDGKCDIAALIQYFETYYPHDEQHFIQKLRELTG